MSIVLCCWVWVMSDNNSGVSFVGYGGSASTSPAWLTVVYAGKSLNEEGKDPLQHIEGVGAIWLFCTHTSQSSGKGEEGKSSSSSLSPRGSQDGIEKTKRIEKTTFLHTNHEKNVTLRAEAQYLFQTSNHAPEEQGLIRSSRSRFDFAVASNLSSWRSELTRRDS